MNINWNKIKSKNIELILFQLVAKAAFLVFFSLS